MKVSFAAILFFMAFQLQAKNYIQIPPEFFKVSGEKNVPADLLFAITLAESKLKTNKGRVLPWPWTVNHRGTPLRFSTRKEMYDYCQGLVNKGDRLFDVGFAQVNWRWHSERFESLWDATEPLTNLRGAASYLRERYDVTGNWWVAVGEYHNPGDINLARNYSNTVRKIWHGISADLEPKKRN